MTILTPIVFAPVAGYIATWVPQHFPGIGYQPTSAQILGLFTVGAGAALAAAYKWLDGWQKHEATSRFSYGGVVSGTAVAPITIRHTGESPQPRGNLAS